MINEHSVFVGILGRKYGKRPRCAGLGEKDNRKCWSVMIK
jgi:hypothetical protein